MKAQEILATPSFFDSIDNNSDEKSTNYKLWLTLNEFEEQYGKSFEQIDKGNVLYSGIMCKQENNLEVNEYLFKFYDKYLVQCTIDKTKPIIIAIMPLLFVRLEYQDTEDNDDDLPFLLFTKNKKFDIIVPDSQKSFKHWLNLLRPRCILTFFGEFYSNTKIIGKGSFAKVMVCFRHADNKEFAVKIYDKKKIENSKNARQTKLGIQNEVKLLQQLNHKNIIKFQEIYEGQYHIYLLLELLTGGELFDKLQTKENYSEKDAYLLMKNLFQAVDYLHEQGIMHRDIKPENLILRSSESETEIVLADFGLSEMVVEDESQLLFKRCGTPGYVAPELLNNLKYDTQVDVFSLGIIFYIILTGYSPFFGDTYNQILENNKKCQICFDFHKIGLSLSPQVIDLLKQMLNPNPKKRITVKQALSHPWMKSFSSNKSDRILEILEYKTNNTSKLKEIIKSTKPQDLTDSKNMIMVSPIINGNVQEINSPFNYGSPEVLEYTPVEHRKSKNFSCTYQSAINSVQCKDVKIMK